MIDPLKRMTFLGSDCSLLIKRETHEKHTFCKNEAIEINSLSLVRTFVANPNVTTKNVKFHP
jgi:hypothetical protein